MVVLMSRTEGSAASGKVKHMLGVHWCMSFSSRIRRCLFSGASLEFCPSLLLRLGKLRLDEGDEASEVRRHEVWTIVIHPKRNGISPIVGSKPAVQNH